MENKSYEKISFLKPMGVSSVRTAQIQWFQAPSPYIWNWIPVLSLWSAQSLGIGILDKEIKSVRSALAIVTIIYKLVLCFH